MGRYGGSSGRCVCVQGLLQLCDQAEIAKQQVGLRRFAPHQSHQLGPHAGFRLQAACGLHWGCVSERRHAQGSRQEGMVVAVAVAVTAVLLLLKCKAIAVCVAVAAMVLRLVCRNRRCCTLPAVVIRSVQRMPCFGGLWCGYCSWGLDSSVVTCNRCSSRWSVRVRVHVQVGE